MTQENMNSYKVTAFGERLEKITEPVKAPAGTELLLRVVACGVCHSDLHLSDGHFDLGDGKAMSLSRTMTLPHTLGHEIVAEVVALGENAEAVPVGSRWLIYPWIGCGKCGVCQDGDEHLCAQPQALGITRDGGFSDHVMVPHARYLIDYGTIPAEVACTYACSGLTAFSALRKAGSVSEDKPLLIIGAGGVGQSAISLCQVVYGAAAHVADIDPSKREAALALGASRAINPLEEGLARSLLKEHGGYATVIDFVGSQKTVEFGMSLLRKGGKQIVVGLFGGSVQIPIPTLPLRSISIEGSYVGTLEELRELAALGRAGKVPAIAVQHRCLSEVQATLDELRNGAIPGRAVVYP